MDMIRQQIAAMERINYEATLAITQTTPGLELHLREDVILTSSDIFPFSDTTHACLLQSTPQTVDQLIDEVTAYFKTKGMQPAIFVSPACTPADLGDRLLRRGFIRQEAEEAWLALDPLPHVDLPPAGAITVQRIDPTEVLTFAGIFMSAFGLPLDCAPAMAQLLIPSLHVPGVYHYLARCEEQPVGICSLICHQNVGILGSAGVIPAYRGSKASFRLIVEAVQQARRQGVDTLLLQTTAGAPLERLLRINGFKRAFTRIGYILS
jgi:GNAT superfamily N-acetyltransferase